MKKNLATFLSLIFMFSAIIAGIVCLAIFASTKWLYLLLGLFLASLITSIIISFQDRRLDVKIRWIAFIMLVPVIGLFSYIFFGRPYKYSVDDKYKYLNFKKYNKKERTLLVDRAEEELEKNASNMKRAFMISANEQGDLPYINSHADLQFNASEAWINILRDIDAAQEYILIDYYIVEENEVYKNLANLLMKKAKQGVKIYFLFDFIGSYGKFTYLEQLRLSKTGIRLAAYQKLPLPLLSWKANYRTHRKDISIDGKVGYIGGSNISDEYTNRFAKFGFWHDEQVRITGAAVQGIEKIFNSDWIYTTGDDLTLEIPHLGEIYVSDKDKNSNDIIQLPACGPNHANSSHLDILLQIIASAKKRIWLSTPYFVPPTELIATIAAAARAGIDVRLVLPGMTDKPFLLDVSKKHTDLLFDSGVKIYSTSNIFNHTKAYLVDDDISFIGSTNLDYRALFSDQQTMGLIYSKDFNHQLEERFKWDFKVSNLYSKKPSKEHNFLVRGLILLINWASPLL
ncbi:cardiolipin synthase [Mesoplasma lactucae]|uniref:Cardiolipin synthase n=1 Tax=Mesoplasma lactucae ATCC 49193 TaxID=81460 RepID=A0A291ISM9_9MOLU|nr:cardiolipin synthase [Mesoplasma lactucae]ATG97770.1 cardiolipin synthase [Mesoplasma lactucae ATCC 49193]ATZ20453.1 cardiolipin synthetase [Mesoplasma lactucae ATCC 49193]MCL8216625.1 Cardiolipin synthase [Mesoplasma lactucae ATCC 49193]